ncbi:hypothetical protein H6P81_004295 [Aristolochia fimbriata]|uniref:Uncharacterized protein n=1 Tax=Aristolochia fimbriata TaxID=158543 RepID=A0AAV7FF07_ARIFI|nr:hypothetical protein H6P81_004295 [Aristolochia fimbriata]
MSKSLTIAAGVLSATRRCLSSAAEAARKPAATGFPAMRSEYSEATEKTYWMRDPKTGCWIPENRFGEVDPADLRAKVIFNKRDVTAAEC